MGDFDSLAEKYMWKTRGQNCPLCDAMAGRVYTYDIWISASVLPGFHLGCDCYLSKVGIEVPMSDLDVFGSDFDLMLDNHYFLGLNWNIGRKSYNRLFTDAITDIIRETSMSVSEAVKSLTDSEKDGIFNKAPVFAWSEFFQWRVFRTLQMLNKSGDEETISATLEPRVIIPTAPSPSQTYRSGMPESPF